MAIGASYRNGLAIELNVPQDKISSVSGNQLDESYVTIRGNGTEVGNSKAVVFFFDNAHKILTWPGSGVGINVQKDAPEADPVELEVLINFNTPTSLSQLGSAPYNIFMVVNKDREKEIHLPGEPPTELANQDLFSTGNDDSDPNTNTYYQSNNYLPWALNVPIDFAHPTEKTDIRNAYTHFQTWATNQGAQFDDWYLDKTGYRSQHLLISRD